MQWGFCENICRERNFFHPESWAARLITSGINFTNTLLGLDDLRGELVNGSRFNELVSPWSIRGPCN